MPTIRHLASLAALLLAATLPAAAETGYAVQSDATGRAGDHLFRIDLATGIATDVGPTGFDDVESLAFDLGCNHLYGVDDVSDRLLTCDRDTGACQSVGKLGVDVTDTGLAMAADGDLYMSTDAPKNPSRLYRLDPETGHATLVGSQGQEVTGLAGARSQPNCASGLYGLGGDGRNNLVCLDTTTGQATVIGPLATVALADGGLDFSADDVLWGLDDKSTGTGMPSQLFTLDLETGRATVKRNLSANGKAINGFEGFALDHGVCATLRVRAPGIVATIPAASTWGLAALALALTGAGFLALRRRSVR